MPVYVLLPDKTSVPISVAVVASDTANPAEPAIGADMTTVLRAGSIEIYGVVPPRVRVEDPAKVTVFELPARPLEL